MSADWKQHLATAPGIAVSLLPKFACPICASASLGILSTLGLGYLLSARYFFPLIASLLVVALATLAFRARSRRGYGPFFIGVIASAGILLGKFKWESAATVYAAAGLLLLGSLWNGWPRASAGCAACETNGLQNSHKGGLIDGFQKKN